MSGARGRAALTEQTRQAVDDYIKTADMKLCEYLFTAWRSQDPYDNSAICSAVV